jgi:hypothetical protein
VIRESYHRSTQDMSAHICNISLRIRRPSEAYRIRDAIRKFLNGHNGCKVTGCGRSCIDPIFTDIEIRVKSPRIANRVVAAMRSTHVGSCEIDGETLILPRFKTYSYALLIAPAWTAARYVAGGGPAVFAICLVVLSISDAAPVVWFLHALGLSIAPRTARWWYVPLAQASLVWVALVVTVTQHTNRGQHVLLTAPVFVDNSQ